MSCAYTTSYKSAVWRPPTHVVGSWCRGRSLVGYFYGYFDESGQFKDRGQKHVALCGWVFEGTPEGGNFAKEWKHELSKVKQIHRRDWGVYDNLRPSRKKLLHNLIPIIHKHAKYGCGVTVDCAAYRKFAKGELRGRLGADAWYLAFLFVLRHLAERKLTKNDYLELTFDWNHQQVIDNANRIFRDIMRKHPRLAEHMPKIGWGASVAYPGLQAADFLLMRLIKNQRVRLILRHIHSEHKEKCIRLSPILIVQITKRCTLGNEHLVVGSQTSRTV